MTDPAHSRPEGGAGDQSLGDGSPGLGPLELRPLGETGLEVSRIGLGLAALGRPGYINLGHADDLGRDYDVERMRARTSAVLDAAWTAGVRYVDAARSYGRAEEFLASWLSERFRPLRSDEGQEHRPAATRPVIGSKWGYTYTAGWRVDAEQHEVKEHSRANLIRQLASSRDLLGDHLDVYQIHSATFSSGALDDDALLDELAEVKTSGLAIGLTLSGPDQAAVLDAALDITRDGRRLFDTVQATYNALERSAGPSLRRARELGLGVIIKEAVANGRLTPRGDVAASSDVLETIAGRHGVSVDAIALADVLAEDWVDIVLSGAATTEHLRSNLAAASVHLADVERKALAGLVELPQDYWRTRASLDWT